MKGNDYDGREEDNGRQEENGSEVSEAGEEGEETLWWKEIDKGGERGAVIWGTKNAKSLGSEVKLIIRKPRRDVVRVELEKG